MPAKNSVLFQKLASQLPLLQVHLAAYGDHLELERVQGCPRHVQSNIMAGRALLRSLADSCRSIFRILRDSAFGRVRRRGDGGSRRGDCSRIEQLAQLEKR